MHERLDGFMLFLVKVLVVALTVWFVAPELAERVAERVGIHYRLGHQLGFAYYVRDYKDALSAGRLR